MREMAKHWGCVWGIGGLAALVLMVSGANVCWAQDSGLSCLRAHLKKAFKLEELGEPSAARKSYRRALSCKNPPASQLRFARARLASFQLKTSKCRACAAFQLCQIKDMSVSDLPAKMTPQAKSLFRLIKSGAVTCPPKGARDLQKNPYILYKPSKEDKKQSTKIKVGVLDLGIKSVGVVYTLPGSTKLKKISKPCQPGPCRFQIKFKFPKKAATPIFRYHYQLTSTNGKTNLHDKLGLRFKKVLVPVALYQKKACVDLKGSPHNPKSSKEAIIKWMSACQLAGKKKNKLAPWVLPVVFGVGGLIIGAAAGIVVTYVVMSGTTTATVP